MGECVPIFLSYVDTNLVSSRPFVPELLIYIHLGLQANSIAK
jgi:hypothetical protein